MNERLIKRRWLEEAKSERRHWLSQDIETDLDGLTSLAENHGSRREARKEAKAGEKRRENDKNPTSKIEETRI